MLSSKNINCQRRGSADHNRFRSSTVFKTGLWVYLFQKFSVKLLLPAIKAINYAKNNSKRHFKNWKRWFSFGEVMNNELTYAKPSNFYSNQGYPLFFFVSSKLSSLELNNRTYSCYNTTSQLLWVKLRV